MLQMWLHMRPGMDGDLVHPHAAAYVRMQCFLYGDGSVLVPRLLQARVYHLGTMRFSSWVTLLAKRKTRKYVKCNTLSRCVCVLTYVYWGWLTHFRFV